MEGCEEDASRTGLCQKHYNEVSDSIEVVFVLKYNTEQLKRK